MWLADEEATTALGIQLGEGAGPGTVIALVGELGMGKSVLARGIGRGLGVTERIPSPTFVILNSYTTGRLDFNHGDLYRLSDPEELLQLGLDEAVFGAGVTVLEWADRFRDALPEDHIRIELVEEGQGRNATITATGPTAATLVQRLV